jgi:hypothetical protein
MTRPRLSAAERQAKLDIAHDQLVTELTSLTTSADWLHYLGAMGRFHSYSASNALLIACQRPDATRVAGFHAWRAFDRRVKKGAKGIAIWAPVTNKEEVEGTDPTESPLRRRVGFRIVYVFDVSDTEGGPLPVSPAPTRPLVGEAPNGMWDLLAHQITTAGYRIELVEYIAHSPSASGSTIPSDHVVQIATAERSPAAKVKSLSHELAHVLLHIGAMETRTLDRSRAELEAESVAYLVCAAFGMDSLDYTLGYVANWSGGDPNRVLATASTVQRCAREILDAIDVLDNEGKISSTPTD